MEHLEPATGFRLNGSSLPAVLLSVFLACSGNGPGLGADVSELDAEPADKDAGVDTADNGPPTEPTVVDEDFRFVYVYSGRTGTSEEGLHDLMLGDPREADPSRHVSLSAKSLDPLGLDCSLGCLVDGRMKWLAVATAQAGQDALNPGTYTLKLAGFAADLSLTVLDEFGAIQDVKHLEFGDGFLFFTSPQKCLSEGGIQAPCFRVGGLDLEQPGAATDFLTMPPPSGPDSKIQEFSYFGRFDVGEDGRTLLFMLPTNVSQSVWAYDTTPGANALVNVVADICTAKDPGGNCIGSGESSTYTDSDPVALSPDGRTLVFVLVEADELRLYRFDMQTRVLGYSVLLGVPSGYAKNACYNREPWQFVFVRRPIRFTRDGDEVMLLGGHKCGDNKRKAWTNIVRIALDRIGGGESLGPGDLRPVTHYAEGGDPESSSISWFDLSPSGEYTVFTGTPVIQEDGSPIQAGSRHINDSEVFVVRTDGTALPVQLTNKVTRRADYLVAVPAP